MPDGVLLMAIARPGLESVILVVLQVNVQALTRIAVQHVAPTPHLARIYSMMERPSVSARLTGGEFLVPYILVFALHYVPPVAPQIPVMFVSQTQKAMKQADAYA